MMGQMDGGAYYEIQDRPATEDRQYAWYRQENWKVNHRLTLNLGLRYDVSMPRTDRFNRQNWLDLDAAFPVPFRDWRSTAEKSSPVPRSGAL